MTVTPDRAGPFPDAVARLLGWERVDVDPEAGSVEVAFTVPETFTDVRGHVPRSRRCRRPGTPVATGTATARVT